MKIPKFKTRMIIVLVLLAISFGLGTLTVAGVLNEVARDVSMIVVFIIGILLSFMLVVETFISQKKE